jgi:NAD(P)-dependent dehydrogenase (short-subunit alcohol dehydrogenase family)
MHFVMQSESSLDKRIVLVTGAKGGLGTSITKAFLKTGATVVGASRSIAADDFPEASFVPLSADFTKATGANAAIEFVATRFGRLDVLVHVIGGFAGGKTIAETDDATWEQMRDLNLTSAFYTFRTAIPHLRKSSAGRIVAIGSLTATEPHAGLGAYVIFKSALTTLVRTIALENKDAGLAASVVLPGTMDTPANRESMPSADFSKWVQPDEVAKLVLSLSETNSRHLTGVAIPIEGEGD